MGDNQERQSIYFIPDNFIDEPRIFMGLFKRRNFLEGLLLSIIGLIPALLIPCSTPRTRITWIIIFCAPFMIAGILGYNGDPISKAIKNARNYRKNKEEKLYNTSTRVLKYSPLDAMLGQSQTRDKVVEVYDSYKKKREDKIREASETEKYKFAYDPDIDDYVTRTRKDGKKNTEDILIQPSQSREVKIIIKQDLNDFNDLYDLDESMFSSEKDR